MVYDIIFIRSVNCTWAERKSADPLIFFYWVHLFRKSQTLACNKIFTRVYNWPLINNLFLCTSSRKAVVNQQKSSSKTKKNVIGGTDYFKIWKLEYLFQVIYLDFYLLITERNENFPVINPFSSNASLLYPLETSFPFGFFFIMFLFFIQFWSPIAISEWLLFCYGNLITHVKQKWK